MHADPIDLLKLLGNEHRLKIALLLARGDHTSESMVEATGLSWQSFTHHLTRFRNRGYVNGKRNGRNVLYSLNDPDGDIQTLLSNLTKQYRSENSDTTSNATHTSH